MGKTAEKHVSLKEAKKEDKASKIQKKLIALDKKVKKLEREYDKGLRKREKEGAKAVRAFTLKQDKYLKKQRALTEKLNKLVKKENVKTAPKKAVYSVTASVSPAFKERGAAKKTQRRKTAA